MVHPDQQDSRQLVSGPRERRDRAAVKHATDLSKQSGRWRERALPAQRCNEMNPQRSEQPAEQRCHVELEQAPDSKVVMRVQTAAHQALPSCWQACLCMHGQSRILTISSSGLPIKPGCLHTLAN